MGTLGISGANTLSNVVLRVATTLFGETTGSEALIPVARHKPPSVGGLALLPVSFFAFKPPIPFFILASNRLQPVSSEANGRVILSEQPLMFLRDQKGAAFLLLDKDKAFPGGMEKVAATTAAAGGEAAGAKAKVKYTDHWLSAGDVALLEAALGKVDDVLRQNRAAIQKLQ